MDKLNAYIPIFLITNILNYVFGLYLLFKLGGVKRNFPFFVAYITYLVYLLISPIYYYYSGVTNLFKIPIYDYYGVGFFYYNIAVFLFFLGYIPILRKNTDLSTSTKEYKVYQPKIKALFVFALFFFLSFADVILNGISIFSILTGKSDTVLGEATTNNYLEAFADSVIICVLLAYYYEVRRPLFFVLFTLAMILFLLLAFRYRIIILVIGLFGIYVAKYGLPLKRILPLIPIAAVGVYFMMFISVNRWEIARGDYEVLSYDPSEFDYDMLFNQTRGFISDLALLRYYHVDDPPHDYGVSMFAYIFVRAIPAQFFPNGQKPYPAPVAKICIDMLGKEDKYADNYGEAVTNLAHFYISFGLFGLFVMSFGMGLLLKMIKNFTFRRFPFEFAFLISLVIGMGLFQFQTRGYLPQVIQNYAYLIVPLILFRWLTKYKFQLISHSSKK